MKRFSLQKLIYSPEPGIRTVEEILIDDKTSPQDNENIETSEPSKQQRIRRISHSSTSQDKKGVNGNIDGDLKENNFNIQSWIQKQCFAHVLITEEFKNQRGI